MKIKNVILSVMMMMGVVVFADHGGGTGGPIIVEPGEDPIIVPIEEDPIILPVENTRLHCASSQYRYQECHVGGRVVAVDLVQQLSHARCQKGRTFGIAHRGIFVDRGCRGIFRAIYVCENEMGGHDHFGYGTFGHEGGLEFLEVN